MATATAELEAAISALSAKKQRLQDSFDRLAASAPIPIPFTWDDINAHISSLQSSIAVRFLKLQSLQLQPAAPTTTEEEDPVEHRGNEDRKPYLEHYTRGNEEEGERANGRVEGAIKASHGLELEKEEEDENENENSKKTATASSAHRSNGEFAGGVRQDLVAACVNMDTSTLVDMLYRRNMTFSRARSQFLPALLGAAEPHALVVAAVRDFLFRTEPKNNAHWDNCGSLLHCARELTDEPSAGTLEQANRLAQDWKEMIGKPQSSRDLGRLAVWGLLRFLVLYNITLEFDASEIIHHLGCLPAKKKRHCIELCNHLGLIRTMTDSVNHLIQNGQQLDAIRLACVLNLTDKYPPLSMMNEYVDKAKKTAQEILSMESDSLESLNQAMTKQVNALILSWRAVDEYNIESVHRNSIKAEITRLLHEYAHKRQSLSDASSPGLNEEQQEQCQQELQMLEEQLREKQQTKEQELQPKWSGQESGEKGQNKKRKRNNYRQKMHHRFHKQPRLSHAGSFAHSAYNAGSGFSHQRGQRFPGVRGGAIRYGGPYYRSEPHPAYRPE
nr:FRIGIDA-like protein 4a isoform X2 [Lolium perenne]